MSSAAAAHEAIAAASNTTTVDEASRAGNGVQQGLAAIAEYIPSEALATFLGLWGLVSALQNPTQDLYNAIVLIGYLAVPFFLAIGFDFKVQRFVGRFGLLLLFGLISFTVWLLALPGGPWSGTINVLGTDMPAETLGGGLVIIVSGSMPKIASLLGLRK